MMVVSFKKVYSEIYLPQLELKWVNKSDTGASLLDLDIKIGHDKKIFFFKVSLYDKGDSFPFFIVRMQYLCSNISSKIFCDSLGTEIPMIARTQT